MFPDYRSDKGGTIDKRGLCRALTISVPERCVFFLKTYSCGRESGRKIREYAGKEPLISRWRHLCLNFVCQLDISNRKRESLEIDIADLEEVHNFLTLSVTSFH